MVILCHVNNVNLSYYNIFIINFEKKMRQDGGNENSKQTKYIN